MKCDSRLTLWWHVVSCVASFCRLLPLLWCTWKMVTPQSWIYMCLISVAMVWTLLFVIPREGESGCPSMGNCIFLAQLPWSQWAWGWRFPQRGTHMVPGPTLSLVSDISQRRVHVGRADTLSGHCCNYMTPFWAIAEGEPWHLPLPVSLVFIIKTNIESDFRGLLDSGIPSDNQALQMALLLYGKLLLWQMVRHCISLPAND